MPLIATFHYQWCSCITFYFTHKSVPGRLQLHCSAPFKTSLYTAAISLKSSDVDNIILRRQLTTNNTLFFNFVLLCLVFLPSHHALQFRNFTRNNQEPSFVFIWAHIHGTGWIYEPTEFYHKWNWCACQLAKNTIPFMSLCPLVKLINPKYWMQKLQKSLSRTSHRIYKYPGIFTISIVSANFKKEVTWKPTHLIFNKCSPKPISRVKITWVNK